MLKFRQRTLRRTRKIMASRRADFMVGEESDPYLKRWRLTPKWLMPICAIYLHEFCKDDDDVPHDHPYLFCMSWILDIGYYEWQFSPLVKNTKHNFGIDPDYREPGTVICKWVPAGGRVWRWGWTAHRIQLKVFNVLEIHGQSIILTEGMNASSTVKQIPHPISLFFCGPRVREWGFHCPQGWKVWREYIAPTSYGNRVGKGCAE
jgi:hypothetical protein